MRPGPENGALLLLLTAALVAMVTRRLRVPYSVGLVAAGIGIALIPFLPQPGFSQEFIYTGLLPPLLFEGAFHLRWSRLRSELPLVLALAGLGVVMSSALTAAGMHYLVHWSWVTALIFGTLIAATDPVAVLATFRETKVQGRLRLLLESESLFNDGTAAVAFGAAMALARGQTPSLPGIALSLLSTVGGALIIGAAVAVVALFLIGRTEDHLVELTFTTVAAYGSFVIAEHAHGSGVVATIVAGLIMGNRGPMGVLSDPGRQAVEAFWEYAAFAANSLVFLLIGTLVGHGQFVTYWGAAGAGILFVLLGRAVAVYPICGAFWKSRLRVGLRQQHGLFWGGLRGALALALALGIPENMPERSAIITVSFAVVAFSNFVQGLTITPLLRRLGELSPSAPAAPIVIGASSEDEA